MTRLARWTAAPTIALALGLAGCTGQEPAAPPAGGAMEKDKMSGAMDPGKMEGAMDKGKMEGGAMEKGKMDDGAMDKGKMDAPK